MPIKNNVTEHNTVKIQVNYFTSVAQDLSSELLRATPACGQSGTLTSRLELVDKLMPSSLWVKVCQTSLIIFHWLLFPQHFFFYETSTHVSIEQLPVDYKLGISI